MTTISRRAALAGAAAALLAALGCTRYPEVSSKENLGLMKALYTACSSKDPVRLAKVEAALEQRLAAGAITAEEADTIRRVLATAKEGKWDAAADDSYAFAKAQRR